MIQGRWEYILNTYKNINITLSKKKIQSHHHNDMQGGDASGENPKISIPKIPHKMRPIAPYSRLYQL